MNTNKEWRGEQAKHLLDHEILTEIFDALRQAYIRQWMAGQTVEAREDVHRFVAILDRVRADLKSISTTGELERKRLAGLSGQKPKLWSVI